MDALCRQLPTVQEEASHLKMFLLAGQSSALGEQAGSLFLPSPGRGRCWRSQPSRPDLAGRWPTEHMNDCFSGQGHVFTGQAWVWAETAERETSWEMDGIKFVAGYLKRPWACRDFQSLTLLFYLCQMCTNVQCPLTSHFVLMAALCMRRENSHFTGKGTEVEMGK